MPKEPAKKKALPKEKVKQGRPKKKAVIEDGVLKDERYYQDLLCKATRVTTKGLKRLIEELRKVEPGFPNSFVVAHWKMEDEDFVTRYARAKEEQVENLVEEMVDIADDDSLDMAFKDDGTPFINTEHIQRSKLRIETRKWIASKLKCKKYGDKIEQQLTGKDGESLSFQIVFGND